MDKTTLSAQNITKIYNGRQIVNNVNVEISSQEIVGILGPNGAGKTTMFYMLSGLILPDSGRIYINQKDVTSLSIHKRTKLGISYLPQESSVFRGLSTKDNVLSIIEQNHEIPKKDRSDKLDMILDSFSLSHVANNIAITLSGGEKRRLEIARIVAFNPRILFLDEPFAGVDPKSIYELKGILTKLKDMGIGILITDHNVRATIDICEKYYIVNSGKIISYGNKEDVINNLEVKKHYLGDDFKL